MRITVEVTQDHIGRGEVGLMRCPIALALREDHGWRNPRVHHGKASGPYWICKLPWRARRFVRKFDAGQPVEPFRFRMGRLRSHCLDPEAVRGLYHADTASTLSGDVSKDGENIDK